MTPYTQSAGLRENVIATTFHVAAPRDSKRPIYNATMSLLTALNLTLRHVQRGHSAVDLVGPIVHVSASSAPDSATR